MGMLFRDATGEWGFEIISEAAQGRTAHENVDELQRFIQVCRASSLSHASEPIAGRLLPPVARWH